MPKHGSTITHPILGLFGSGRVLLKPASPGTGVIAGGGVRAVLELAGIHDILSKIARARRTRSTSSRRRSTGCRSCARPEEVAELRGLSINQVLGLGGEPQAAETLPSRTRRADADAGRAAEPEPERRGVSTVKVTQVKSRNGADQAQRDTLRSLGLRRIGHTVEVKDTPQARGMLHARPPPREDRGMSTDEHDERIGLHTLKPAPGSRKARKRVGRGEGSGIGKTSGRGQKGYGSRSGAKDRARFEGGQMPIHMRMRKLRGPHMKKSMPFEPFRTHTQAVNLRRPRARASTQGAEVTLEALVAKGLGTAQGRPGQGARPRAS